MRGTFLKGDVSSLRLTWLLKKTLECFLSRTERTTVVRLFTSRYHVIRPCLKVLPLFLKPLGAGMIDSESRFSKLYW